MMTQESNHKGLLIEYNLKGVIVSANQATTNFLGYKKDKELIGKNMRELFLKREAKENVEVMMKSMKDKVIVEDHIAILVNTNNEELPVSLNFIPLIGSERKVIGGYGLIEDLRELKNLLRRLEELKAELEERVKERTQQLEKAQDELKKWNIMLEEKVEERTKQLRKVNEELLIVNKALEAKTEELEKTNQELKSTQAQLVQSAKLASLGELAGGLAHEINNPLASIYARAQLLLSDRNRADLSPKVFKYLQTIEKQAERAANIIENLLHFSRRSEQQEQHSVSVNKVIEDVLVFTEHLISLKNIEIDKKFGLSLPQIIANENQLQQVILNIINNAADAMTDSGTLTIKTYLNSVTKGELGEIVFQGRRKTDPKRKHSFKKGDKFVGIQIQDTGCGIPEEDLHKILDPFFTTKEVGKGTGLGLSLSYGIIEQHGGEIDIESEVGVGTTFTIKLPVK